MERDVSVERARSILLDGLTALETVRIPVGPGAPDARLRRRPALAESLRARWNLPGADTSVMDGFAVRAADLAGSTRLRIVGESAAGHPSGAPLAEGEAARISTGAVLPPGADAVVPVEDTSERENEGVVEIHEATTAGRFVRPRGSDVRLDEILLEAGASLGPGELALLMSAGHAAVPVVRPPRVGIVCTGDELVEPVALVELVERGVGLAPGAVVSTNGTMLALQAERAGAEVVEIVHATDDLAATLATLDEVLANVDLLLTSGGISVGRHDLVLTALERLGSITMRKTRLRPGRPTTFARIGDKRVLALPGNPASTFVAFELFARPALRRLGGHRAVGPALVQARLGIAMRAERTRDHYVRVRIRDGVATPLASQVSGALRSIALFDGLALLPAGAGELDAGATVNVVITELA